MMYLFKILLKYSTSNNKIKLNILMIRVILYANRCFSCWSLVFGKNFSCDLQHNEAFHVHELANPCRKGRALGLTSLLENIDFRRPNGGIKRNGVHSGAEQRLSKWCNGNLSGIGLNTLGMTQCVVIILLVLGKLYLYFFRSIVNDISST